MDNEKELMDAFLDGDDEPLLPDGWKEGDDIFADSENAEGVLGVDEPEDLSALTGENEEESSDGPDLTTAGEEETDQSADADLKEVSPDGEKKPEEKKSRILRLKVNHTEEDLDIDAMSDEDLTALLQKGRAFDALKDTENKKRFRAVYQEQIDAGMTEAAAKLVAQNEVGGKTYPLEDPADPSSADPAPAPATTPAEPIRDFKAEVEQLKALFPEVKEIPDEVARAAAKGVPLLSAYLALRDKQSAQTAAALKKENQILRQNAASAAKAPVRGVSGGGAAQKPVDPALKGFDMEQW